jgi:hypothetical protein
MLLLLLHLQGVVVVYNLDPDTTNDQLVWIFKRFGEVKDIQQSSQRSNQKFIEFYDVRHAAAALRAMNRAELSRLPGAGPSTATATALHGHSMGAEGPSPTRAAAAVGPSPARPPGSSGDGGLLSPRQGLESAGTSGSGSHALAVAQVAAAVQQLELEQQRSHMQPIPARPPTQLLDNMQQAAHRGMVRPVSGMLDRLHNAVSPPLSLGPLSQSWDNSSNTESLLSGLPRQQQQQQHPSQQPMAQQQQQQQQTVQLLQQQQQQQLLLQQALASGIFSRGSRADLSTLVRSAGQLVVPGIHTMAMAEYSEDMVVDSMLPCVVNACCVMLIMLKTAA